MCKPRRLVVVLLAMALGAVPAIVADVQPEKTFGRPQIDAVKGKAKVIDAKVIDFGKVIYEGPIDVNPTLERIREGKKLEHRNDGVFFQNRERRLPVHKDDREYYREFVLWNPKLNAKFTIKVKFPGPQRVVIGKKGEVYYTGDHYSTWKKVR
jgi:guanyl-specific ribonuclease Sa